MNFPIQSWGPFQIRPSEAVLQRLAHRKFLQCRRKGMTRREARFAAEDWYNEDTLRKRFNLPKESVKYTISSDDWIQYVKLNSFRATRLQAREFFEAHKKPSAFQDWN